MKKWALLLFLLLLAVPKTSAAQWSVQVTIRSYHFKSGDFNEWNFGLGIGRDVGPVDVEVGGYLNSQSELVAYGDAVRSYPEHGNIGAEIGGGVVVGYDEHTILPLVVPGVYVGGNPRLRIIGIPVEGGVIGSQVKYFVP